MRDIKENIINTIDRMSSIDINGIQFSTLFDDIVNYLSEDENIERI
jgi:hypothetical protein